jgi:hypothetical protein
MKFWIVSWDNGDGTDCSSNATQAEHEVVPFVRNLQTSGRRILSVKEPDGRLWNADKIQDARSIVRDVKGA